MLRILLITHSSCGYSGATGQMHCSGVRSDTSASPFAQGDTVGCGVDNSNNTVFFVRNGVLVGRSNKLPEGPVPLYPAVSMSGKGQVVVANFTGPFRFSLDLLVSEAIASEQSAIDRSPLCMPTGLIPDIIADYMYSQGFTESLQAFTNRFTRPFPGQTCQLRGRVRQLIEGGEVLRAIDEIERVYPNHSTTSESLAVVLLLAQQVRELLHAGEEIEALRYLKTHLSRFRDFQEPAVYRTVTDACKLFCLTQDIATSLQARRKEVANEVNKDLLSLTNEATGSRIEMMVKQVVACRNAARKETGRGLVPFAELAYTRARQVGRLEASVVDKRVGTDS